jgi:WD40 repeat protein
VFYFLGRVKTKITFSGQPFILNMEYFIKNMPNLSVNCLFIESVIVICIFQSINSAHKDWICALGVMPESNTVLSGCRAGYLKLWQMDTCAQIAEIRAHTSPINAIATNSSTVFTASK